MTSDKFESDRFEYAGEIDPDTEPVYDLNGNRLTGRDFDRLADWAEKVGPPIGRPSLGGRQGRSPMVSHRLPAELRQALAEEADREGRSESAVIRAALTEYLDRHQPA